MVTIEQIKKFKEVKEKFDTLSDTKRVRVLKALDANKKIESLTYAEQRRLLFRYLYDPTKSAALVKSVEAA